MRQATRHARRRTAVRADSGPSDGVTGPARLGRATDQLARTLRPGDVAVIDHVDLDRASAEALVARGVAAVVNAAPSTSGRYPNLGPGALLAAGVPLVDGVGEHVFAAVRDGQQVHVDGSDIVVGDRCVATGEVQTQARVQAAMDTARQGLASQMEAFAAGTGAYLQTDPDLLLDGLRPPTLQTPIGGRDVLVVAPGPHVVADLVALRRYVRARRPVLVGVDAGADLLRAQGWIPDLIVVGDPTALTTTSLHCGAEVIAHRRSDVRAASRPPRELGVPSVPLTTPGTSEDAALLLVSALDARLVVLAGSHASLAEFLDRDSAGMASAFITRLRVGARLVDASTAARLHVPPVRTASLMLLVVAAAICSAVALTVAAHGASVHDIGHAIAHRWQVTVDTVHRWLRSMPG